ncbi:hypothetical protein ABT297_03110 [Dactylosporangium sp. NPDC000555]|uniref:hypothetical protein n=1 Tax=Dactylosporangium sp. NPDC000555 TaxID=3154260 RepID=UPI00331D2075
MPKATDVFSFGIKTSQMGLTYAEILDTWRAADAAPAFSHAWLWDHMVPLRGPVEGAALEAWTLLAALAAQTSRAPSAAPAAHQDRDRHPVGGLTGLWFSRPRQPRKTSMPWLIRRRVATRDAGVASVSANTGSSLAALESLSSRRAGARLDERPA